MAFKCRDCGEITEECNLAVETYPRYCAYDEIITKCPECGCDLLDEVKEEDEEVEQPWQLYTRLIKTYFHA